MPANIKRRKRLVVVRRTTTKRLGGSPTCSVDSARQLAPRPSWAGVARIPRDMRQRLRTARTRDARLAGRWAGVAGHDAESGPSVRRHVAPRVARPANRTPVTSVLATRAIAAAAHVVVLMAVRDAATAAAPEPRDTRPPDSREISPVGASRAFGRRGGAFVLGLLLPPASRGGSPRDLSALLGSQSGCPDESTLLSSPFCQRDRMRILLSLHWGRRRFCVHA